MRSLRKLINEKCKQCAYDPLDRGNWRMQTGSCNIKSCPLWEVRPVSSTTVVADDETTAVIK